MPLQVIQLKPPGIRMPNDIQFSKTPAPQHRSLSVWFLPRPIPLTPISMQLRLHFQFHLSHLPSHFPTQSRQPQATSMNSLLPIVIRTFTHPTFRPAILTQKHILQHIPTLNLFCGRYWNWLPHYCQAWRIRESGKIIHFSHRRGFPLPLATCLQW